MRVEDGGVDGLGPVVADAVDEAAKGPAWRDVDRLDRYVVRPDIKIRFDGNYP